MTEGDLTAATAARIEDALTENRESDLKYLLAAQAAQREVARQVSHYAQAIVTACVERRHPGSSQPRDGIEAQPCRTCAVQVRHIRRVSTLIDPEHR